MSKYSNNFKLEVVKYYNEQYSIYKILLITKFSMDIRY